jgi:hypothetical protein
MPGTFWSRAVKIEGPQLNGKREDLLHENASRFQCSRLSQPSPEVGSFDCGTLERSNSPSKPRRVNECYEFRRLGLFHRGWCARLFTEWYPAVQPRIHCWRLLAAFQKLSSERLYQVTHFTSSAGCPILCALCKGWDTMNLDTGRRVSHPLQRAQRMGHPPIRGASCCAKHQPRLNRELVSYRHPPALPTHGGMKRVCFLSETDVDRFALGVGAAAVSG